MRITVKSSLRATQVFRLMEALESRELLTDYTKGFLVPMTGKEKDGTGYGPQGLYMASDDVFYGTTYTGGPKGYGTVFKIFRSGTEQKLITLASFTGKSGTNPGLSPTGSLVVDADG